MDTIKFPSELGDIDLQVFGDGQLREIYDAQLSIPEFEEEFKADIQKTWTDLISDIETVQNTGDKFDLATWANIYNDEAINTISENNFDALENVSVKMLALYYAVKHLALDKDGIFRSKMNGFQVANQSEEMNQLEETLMVIEGLTLELYTHYLNKSKGDENQS